jgi:hypothetical protein
MAPADTAERPARAALKRKPPTPKALQAKKLTIARAVDQYVEAMHAIEVLSDLRDKAKEMLITHGERTGRRTFLDRLAMERTGGSLVLDQAQAKADLTEAGLPIPKKRSKLGWTLKLLEKPPAE